jgi:NCAIR mutase (PurE)-related protein
VTIRVDERELRLLVEKLVNREISVERFVDSMKSLPFRDLGEVKFDTHRALRRGFPEIVYCPGKRDEQLDAIACMLSEMKGNALFSRMTEKQFTRAAKILPDLEYLETPRLGRLWRDRDSLRRGKVLVVTGGSSDVPVAEEAAVTAETMGCIVKRLFDVGIAGLHRLLASFDELRKAEAIIAVAGMDGALPGVVAGMTDCPVIGLPTSVGYGAALAGFGPLLTMLNSCALGVTVVNVDNGIGAGYAAAVMTGRKKTEGPEEKGKP